MDSEACPEHALLQDRIVHCTRCDRLVAYRQKVASEKRKAYRDCLYWGRPVPSLGKPDARLLIIGLAPAAHGANRTGRMFTGDRSGDFLFSALHRFGFGSQPSSVGSDDGLELTDVYITAAIHCAPPANRPSIEELTNCRGFLASELSLLRHVKVVVALGHIAFRAYLSASRSLGKAIPKPLPRFVHARPCELDGIFLMASYHPSRQNTQTGRLTREMFERVFQAARELLDRQ